MVPRVLHNVYPEITSWSDFLESSHSVMILSDSCKMLEQLGYFTSYSISSFCTYAVNRVWILVRNLTKQS
jgi:hypothetical protein